MVENVIKFGVREKKKKCHNVLFNVTRNMLQICIELPNKQQRNQRWKRNAISSNILAIPK